MSTLNVLQDLVNNGITRLYVGKIERKKSDAIGTKVKCGILIDKAWVAKEEIHPGVEKYLDASTLLEAHVDCRRITGRPLINNYRDSIGTSKLGMVITPEGYVDIKLDTASEYITLVTA